MICQFKRLIYPKAVTAGDASYMIALYRPCEKVMDAAGNVVSEIKAVGYCLPTADNLRYDMRGRWSRSAKHGIQFEVEGFDEVIVPSKEGVIFFLVVLGMPLFFLSGVAWPAEAMPEFLRIVALAIPSTTAVPALVRVNQMGADLRSVETTIFVQLALCLAYSMLAVAAERWKKKPSA